MNQQLVRGQALVNQSKVNNWQESFQEGLSDSLKAGAIIAANAKAEKNAINSKVANYINQLNSDIDLTELNESQTNAMKNYLVQNRNEYAQAASRIARIEDTSSPEYLELVDKMNSVQRSFGNLAKQLNAYKEDKISYLKDFDDRRLSAGNELAPLKNAASIYTGEASMGIGPGGQLTFWNDNNGTYENYSTIQKPFLKDFKTADSILKLNESIYSSGSVLSGARKNMIKNNLKSMINNGGRDTLLSLATDDFMLEGGLNIQDQTLFEPGNEDLLRDVVLNSYMQALEDTSAQGAKDKVRSINKRSNNTGTKETEWEAVKGKDGKIYARNTSNGNLYHTEGELAEKQVGEGTVLRTAEAGEGEAPTVTLNFG